MKKLTTTFLIIVMLLGSANAFAQHRGGWNSGSVTGPRGNTVSWNRGWQGNSGWNNNGGCWGSNCGWALAGAAIVGGLTGAAIANNNGGWAQQPVIVSAPPMVIVQQPQVVAVQPITAADRLVRLDFLFNQRLISIDEYQIQRQRIISGL